MSSIDFLDYFLVKERLVDMSHRENLELARNGDALDKVISDVYLARKVVYQQCKAARSLPDLNNILKDLEENIPDLGMVFNKEEFEKAWHMTIGELREKFELNKHINH